MLEALNKPAGAAALTAAGLRNPRAAKNPTGRRPGAQQLPPLAAKAMPVLKPHHVDHVLATWYIQDRRTDLLMVVDASGSMDDPAPGTRTPSWSSSARAAGRWRTCCPTTAGSACGSSALKLDPPRDYRPLLAPGPLNAAHRQATVNACGRLKTDSTGTGLYDTILAAYNAAKETYRPGVPQPGPRLHRRAQPGRVVASLAQLKANLAKAHDPKKPVNLSVVIFGDDDVPVEAIDDALGAVDGYLDTLKEAAEVPAVFIHVAAGGLHE